MDYSIPIGRNYKTIDALLMAAGEAFRNACVAGSPTFAKQSSGNVERSEAKQSVGNVERSEAKQIVGNVELSEAKQSSGNVEHIEARRGSGNAHRSDIEALLDQHGDRVLRLAYSYLHNMSDAEDILQETMICYFEKAPEEMSEEHKKSWLLRVAANLAKNRIKYNKLREADELNEELVAEGREDLAFVWEAVKNLPDKYSEVIHLFYYEGLKAREVAEVLEMEEATVRSLLSRGRAKLKEVLKTEYDFGE